MLTMNIIVTKFAFEFECYTVKLDGICCEFTVNRNHFTTKTVLFCLCVCKPSWFSLHNQTRRNHLTVDVYDKTEMSINNSKWSCKSVVPFTQNVCMGIFHGFHSFLIDLNELMNPSLSEIENIKTKKFQCNHFTIN